MKKTVLPAVLAAFLAAPFAVIGEDNSDSVLREIGLSDAWRLSLTVFAEFGDNRDSVPDHYSEDVEERYRYEKEDDIKYGIQPTISYASRFTDIHSYKLSYSPIYHYWTNPRVGKDRSEFSHLAYAEFKWSADTRNVFVLRDNFKYILNDRWTLDEEAVERTPITDSKHVEHEQEHYDNTVHGEWKHQLSSRVNFDIDGFWNTIRYNDDEIAENSDEDKIGATFKLSRATSAQFQYGLYFRFLSWDDQDTVWTSRDGRYVTEKVERGIQTYTIGIGSTYRWDERLSFTASYGWEWVDYESDTIDDRDFPGDFTLSAVYALTLRTRGILGLRYYVSEAWVYPYASQDLVSFYATLQHTFTARLSGSVRAEYKIGEYDLKYVPEEARNETFVKKHEGDKTDIYVELALNYRYSQAFNVNLAYGYEDVDSDISNSYHENTVRVRATYIF